MDGCLEEYYRFWRQRLLAWIVVRPVLSLHHTSNHARVTYSLHTSTSFLLATFNNDLVTVHNDAWWLGNGSVVSFQKLLVLRHLGLRTLIEEPKYQVLVLKKNITIQLIAWKLAWEEIKCTSVKANFSNDLWKIWRYNCWDEELWDEVRRCNVKEIWYYMQIYTKTGKLFW